MNKKKWVIFLVVAVVFAIAVLVTVIVGTYNAGVRSQKEKINHLKFQAEDEARIAHKLQNSLNEAEDKNDKLQSALKEKDAEIVSKAASLEACEKKVAALSKPPAVKPKRVAKKIASKIASAKTASAPAVEQRISVPALASATQKFILRINVVEWSPIFEGKSLKSRDIGPVVKQGLANGTIVRTKKPLSFLVNGVSVSVQDGSAIVDPGQINPETTLVVQPANGTKFASPPNGLPFTTEPGEVHAAVQRKVPGAWMNFILAPIK